jgi:hypothetical protein
MKLKRRTKVVGMLAVGGLVLLAAGAVFWIRRFHRYTPVEVMQDIRAGIRAQHAPRPVERFLELRYGSLADPANRQKAFLDFFNVGHIEGLHILTSHMHGEQQQTNILAMAQWVADYRRSMTPEEKRTLNACLNTDAGQKIVRQAAAQYLRQDVHYRAATACVIEELMTTLSAVK